MTRFREQLLRARDQHRGENYPGHLGEDLNIATPRPFHLLMQIGVGLAAVAALVLLVFWLGHAPVEIPVAAGDEPTPESFFVIAPFPALAVPEWPEDFSVVVEAPSLAFSVPPFPSPDELDSTSINKETI